MRFPAFERFSHRVIQNLHVRDKTLIIALTVLALVAIAGSSAILRYVESQQIKIGSQTYATRWVEQVRENVAGFDGLLASGQLSAADTETFELMSSVANIARYNIYSAEGVVVFASRSADVGTTNSDLFFTEQVMQGRQYVNVVMDKTFGEDERLLGEVYVPIVSHGGTIGVVQLFLDITRQATGHRLAANISLVAILCLMGATAFAIGVFFLSNIRGRNRELRQVVRSREAAKAAKLQEETARQAAELANRAKSEFLATMSHELRTPLNAIIGFSEIIRNQMFGPLANPKYLDYANDINHSGWHLLKHINDILDISKIEAGKVELRGQNIDVSEALMSCITLVKGQAYEAGVEIETDIPPNLPGLHADEQKFKQITINLLSNAIKFTPAGGKVTLRIWYSLENGYVLQVVDTGIGIALADIPKVLTPFQQIESDLARNYEGTGLGLPLVKGLAELHGGALDLQSEIGVGTTATVRFPAERIEFQTAPHI